MRKIKIAIMLVASLFGFAAFAQPGVAVGSATGQDGTSVTIPIIFTGDGVANGVQMDINYDNMILTPDLSACGTAGGSTVNSSVTCQISVVGPNNVVRILGFSIPSAVSANGTLGDISFAILAGTTPQVLPITVSNEAYSGSAPDGSSTNGSITVTAGPQPDYSSAPAAGSTLALNGNVGGANPTSSVAISNVGPAGAPALTGTCALSGVDAASFSITTATAINVAQGAAAQTMTVDCNASAVTAATLNASLDCTHNGDGTTSASPASYPLTCDIAAITPQYDSTPAVGTTLAMGQILQGGMNPTASIDINNDNGDATTTLTGTCSTVAPFSVTSGANFSILQGTAAATVNVDCDATAAPMVYNGTLSCTHDGSNVPSPATYTLSCEVLAAAASGTQAPADMTTLNITAPPGGTSVSPATVTFSEVGMQGVAITDLNCSVTGPDFAITAPLAFPATVPTAGTLAVDVSFTDPVAPGPYTDTLVCTYTDGTGAVSVSYPLVGAVQALVVPALSWVGYATMILGLMLVGFFGFRRRA